MRCPTCPCAPGEACVEAPGLCRLHAADPARWRPAVLEHARQRRGDPPPLKPPPEDDTPMARVKACGYREGCACADRLDRCHLLGRDVSLAECLACQAGPDPAGRASENPGLDYWRGGS